MALYPSPKHLTGKAADAQKLFATQQFHETISLGERELRALDKKIPARSNKPPQQAAADSDVFQYYALVLILVNAYAELEEWKAAKEVLGKYRVRFPRDPWGFTAGAVVTRRDPRIKDKAAVERAAELLEGEAARLESKA